MTNRTHPTCRLPVFRGAFGAINNIGLLSGVVAVLFAGGCVLGGDLRPVGIRYDDPVVGDREVYIGYRFGQPKSPDSVKTYTNDSLILEVEAVDAETISLSEKMCRNEDAACVTKQVTMNRVSGKVRFDSLGWSALEAVNHFPSGLFTADSTRFIVFKGHFPEANDLAVGYAPELRLGKKTYRNVTVFVDPAGIDYDVGGACLVLTSEGRLVESYRYHVFGNDGGWEARD